MSDPSDVPAVVVERAPDGWTHIGGPGMHLLIGLDEEDDRTIAASDAADGGDLDDVLEVLTAGGMRKAHHFVGVHWQPRTRVVAFGPVSALVTLGDGSEHDVRATSSRVWTDVELPEHPERVVLRVLEESEGGTVTPEPAPAAPERPVASATPAPTAPPRSSPWDRSWATPPPAEAPADPAVVPAAPPVPAQDAGQPPSPASPATPPAAGALRSWESVRPAAVTPTPAATPTPPAPAHASAPPGPLAPAAEPPASEPPGAEPPASEPPGAEPPAAGDLPAAGPRDLDSTWSARPVLDPEPGPTPAPHPADPRPLAPGTSSPVAPARTTDEDAQPAAPSYDYLFGHTTAADEHRRVLAELTRHAEDDTVEDGVVGEVPSVPAVADTVDPPVTNLAPAPEVLAPPLPTVPDLPPVAEGGLISSVPWASPAPAPEAPRPEPAAPTFTGRHTPPPPPSLLPPTNTPPPGVRAPEATPLISTAPTAPLPPLPPLPPQAPPAPGPAPTTEPPPAPTGGTAYPAVPRPPAEPTFDVPIAGHPAAAPGVAGPPPVPTPQLDVAADDDAELTVDRSALLEARRAAQSRTVSGPSVLAVLCSAGHPTPPHGDRCRVCGAGIPPQGPFTMPRPPLGVLRLSTGDVVTLDRSVLLGRAPRLGEGVAAHDRPHVVKVPSPERDISRNHVEVILEGWHVLIRDLGTTNGTTVALPGESPVRLRANDQQVLEPGSFVSMADEVSFTFEAAI